MELHTFAKSEYPFLVVLGVNLPVECQTRNQLTRSACNVGLPCNQGVIDGVASELIGASTLVRLARCEWNVGHRNAVLGDRLSLRGKGKAQDEWHQ